MDQERVTERVDATGTVTERTVERSAGSAGSGGGIMWIIVALIAIAIGAYFLVGMNKSAITTTPLSVVVANKKSLDFTLIDLQKELDG